MALIDEYSYQLVNNITIEGVQGWALKLFPSMFWDITNNQAASAVPAVTFCEGCDYNAASKTITPTISGVFTFKVGATTMSGVAKSSVQNPIRMSEIGGYTGVNSLTASSTSGGVNQNSKYKPDKVAPHGMGEWLNYCHTAEGGAKVIAFSCNKGTAIAYQASFTLTAAIQRRDADVAAIKIAIYKNGGLVSESASTTFNDKYHFSFSTDVTNTSSVTSSAVYEAKAYYQAVAGGEWQLSGTASVWLTLEGIPYVLTVSDVQITGSKQATVILSAQNNTQGNLLFDAKLSLNNATVNTSSTTTFTATASNTTTITLVFAFAVALVIDDLNYTVDAKIYTDTYYKTCNNGVGVVSPM